MTCPDCGTVLITRLHYSDTVLHVPGLLSPMLVERGVCILVARCGACGWHRDTDALALMARPEGF